MTARRAASGAADGEVIVAAEVGILEAPLEKKTKVDLENKQAAKRPLTLGPSGGCPRRLALRTGNSTLHVRIMFM